MRSILNDRSPDDQKPVAGAAAGSTNPSARHLEILAGHVAYSAIAASPTSASEPTTTTSSSKSDRKSGAAAIGV